MEVACARCNAVAEVPESASGEVQCKKCGAVLPLAKGKACTTCGKGLAGHRRVKARGKYYCPECFDKLSAEKKEKSLAAALAKTEEDDATSDRWNSGRYDIGGQSRPQPKPAAEGAASALSVLSKPLPAKAVLKAGGALVLLGGLCFGGHYAYTHTVPDSWESQNSAELLQVAADGDKAYAAGDMDRAAKCYQRLYGAGLHGLHGGELKAAADRATQRLVDMDNKKKQKLLEAITASQKG